MPEQTNHSKNGWFLLKGQWWPNPGCALSNFGRAPDSRRGCRRHSFQEYSLWQNSRTSVQLRTGRVQSMREQFNTGSMESKEKQP
jgi:hypothetical protein